MSRDAVGPGNTTFIAQDWFQVDACERGVFSILEPFHEEQVRSYLVLGEERAVLIDTGMGVGDIRAVVEALTDLPVTVVNSHAHWDHIGGNHLFADIAIHHAEAHELPLGMGNHELRRWFAPERLLGPLPEGFDIHACSIRPSVASALLSGGERIELGGRTLEVIHAPGHSSGVVVFLDRAAGALFSTDVAYAGPLYAFGIDANLDEYRSTLAMLAELAPILRRVYPSHNASPISPDHLPKMRDGLELVVSGRAAESVDDGIARHEFDGFSILVSVDESVTEDR